MFFIQNPFEQFIINPFLDLHFFFIDLTVSNVTLTLFIIICFSIIVISLLKNPYNNSFYLFPTHLDSLIHLAYLLCQYMLERHINVKYYQQAFFPIIFSLAIFLLLINLVGNVPGCMALTSQIGVVCAYSLPMIFGFFAWALYDRQLSFVRTFHSPGTPGSLAIVLFPIEVLTYVMRPVSIICRLVANFMSGHIIFKVFLGGAVEFAFSTKSLSIVYTLLTAASLCFLVVLVILEIAISVIQVYVFVVIFCMFLSDSFGHHFRH